MVLGWCGSRGLVYRPVDSGGGRLGGFVVGLFFVAHFLSDDGARVGIGIRVKIRIKIKRSDGVWGTEG